MSKIIKPLKLKNPLKEKYIAIGENGEIVVDKFSKEPFIFASEAAALKHVGTGGVAKPASEALHPVYAVLPSGEIRWRIGILDESPGCTLAQAKNETLAALKAELSFETRELTVQAKEYEKRRKTQIERINQAKSALRQFEIKYRANVTKLNKGGKKNGKK